MYDPKTNETVTYETTSKLSIPEAKDIAKARKIVYIDKEDVAITFKANNEDLLRLNKARE